MASGTTSPSIPASVTPASGISPTWKLEDTGATNATPKLSAAPKKAEPEAAPVVVAEETSSVRGPMIAALVGGLALLGLGYVAPDSFMDHFTVFVLACFVGYMVIWNVSPALHTPLMSVTNAISSIIVIGALLQISATDQLIMWIAALTVLITSINIAGGFAVTRRMLEMFRK